MTACDEPSRHPLDPEAPLDAEAWHDRLVGGQSPNQVAARIQAGASPSWLQPLLATSRRGDTTLELGSGTGELSAFLAAEGRYPILVDFSHSALRFSREVFARLGLKAQFVEANILGGVPLKDRLADLVWSSGVLEHFTDQQIVGILRESRRISRQTVLSLVPNARSLAYRLGKWVQESRSEWLWGHEEPRDTLAPLFRRAGLAAIRETSIGALHALNFLTLPELQVAARLLASFFEQLPPGEADRLSQGYLLATTGAVPPPCGSTRPRGASVISSRHQR